MDSLDARARRWEQRKIFCEESIDGTAGQTRWQCMEVVTIFEAGGGYTVTFSAWLEGYG